MAAPIYIPANSVGGFPFSTSSPTFVICVLFDDSHFNRCEVISHCGFDLHFYILLSFIFKEVDCDNLLVSSDTIYNEVWHRVGTQIFVK